jgi:hypothetical protein
LLASTSIRAAAEETWLSAWSFPFTIVMSTASSVLPVGAPTPTSRVRTIATSRSRSAWISAGARRHSVMCVSIVPVVEAEAMLAEAVLSVVAVEVSAAPLD